MVRRQRGRGCSRRLTGGGRSHVSSVGAIPTTRAARGLHPSAFGRVALPYGPPPVQKTHPVLGGRGWGGCDATRHAREPRSPTAAAGTTQLGLKPRGGGSSVIGVISWPGPATAITLAPC